VGKSDNVRLGLKTAFVIGSIILATILPLGWPFLSRWECVGKLSLTPMQVLYTILAVEITLAVYIWGVGNWSRFEPAKNTDDSTVGPGQHTLSDAPPPGLQAGPTPKAPVGGLPGQQGGS
jgi:hypothetical protein